MSIDIYNDAFKSLSILNENLFDTSTLGVTKLHSFMDDDFDEDDISIIDPDASNDEELSDSYVGKIIVDCTVCHSHIFKDREDIDIDESGIVNGEDVCPYCGEQEGFVIIGQIEEFNGNGGEEENEPTEEPEVAEVSEVEKTVEEEDKEKNESLKVLRTGQSITEELNECGTLEEAADGDDLANRVLAYLDRLEAKDELTESMNNVKVETDDNVVTVNSDDNGKVTVTTEPVTATGEESGEMIAPISDEEQNALIDAELPAEDMTADVDSQEVESDTTESDAAAGETASEEPSNEESATDSGEETGEVDLELEEIDEESADNLGESYLRRVYENVDSYKTSKSYVRGDRIIVEGIIKFNSGKQSRTGFILEAKSADNTGRVSFTGYNKHFTEDKNAYLFEGKIKDKRLILEKLSYRYTMNENLVRGRVYNK